MRRMEARRRKARALWLRIFPVLGEPAAAVEPGDGALDDPAFGFDDEALGVIGAFDDLDDQTAHRAWRRRPGRPARLGAVGEQLAQERELPEQRGHQQDAAVAILNVGGSHQRVQHQTQCIDQDMALLALDQLARIEAMWIDRGPLFLRFSRSGCR